MPELGAKLQFAVFAVKGDVSQQNCVDTVRKIVEGIGMNPAPGAIMYGYPVDGKGGFGHTYFQPITESFIAFDAWPDLKGAYLVICSCKRFLASDVFKVLQENGLNVVNVEKSEVGLQ